MRWLIVFLLAFLVFQGLAGWLRAHRPGPAAGRLQLPLARPRVAPADRQQPAAQPDRDGDRGIDLVAARPGRRRWRARVPRAPPRRSPAPAQAARRRGFGHRRGVHRQRRAQRRGQARALRVGLVLACRRGRAHRTRRPAALRRSAPAGAVRRSAPAGAAAAAAFSSALRCTLPCSRATTSASSRHSVGTFQRSHSVRTSFTLRISWPMWRGSTSAGVVPLPRSWPRQAKRTGQAGVAAAPTCPAPASGARRCRSPGGARARCGTPHRRSTSGSSRASAPHSRSTSNMRLGRALHQAARQLLPDPLGHQRIDLAGGDHLAHQRQRLAARS